ncbi:MAG TPA: Nif3-like dinuclear metal center hexameric protein [Bacillota bacterium]|nr:Nif3-like dinuclear metal center hexameric protein [Bacillota bacterium]
MNTKEIMDLALELAGLKEIPDDSGIIVAGEDIKKVAFGVDMEAAEMLIARELGVDLVITHHPVGGAPRLNLYKVMENQIERMAAAGVPVNKAQKALREQMGKVERSLHVSNYDRAASAARLLKMPFMGIHSPADVISERTVQQHLDNSLNPRSTLGDVIEALQQIPEYRNALTKPEIRVGAEKDYAGKVFVTMAGGTNGGAKVAQAYFEAGIGTLVCMHMPEEVIKAVKEQNIGNVIVAGHMASDSIGINVIIAALEERGLEVIRMSGVIDPN